MRVHPSSGTLPLLSFALFDSAEPCAVLPVVPPGDHHLDEPRFSLAYEEYAGLVAAIRERIARGDTYQVNLTQRLTAAFRGDPRSLFLALQRAQQAPCAAYLHLGTLAVCSASPELFFELDGHDITCRPMKGTSPRGHDLVADQEQMEWLRTSEKNRAENLMIVDMVRNDLARIAEIGSVDVSALWTVERYPTVLQMTSTVRARTRASLVEVMQALFPSASITGAPKIRAMELISQLERSPRDIYTGAIGFIAPGRRAHFNVAIRTAVVDPALERLVFGVGGGIVWDSNPPRNPVMGTSRRLLSARSTSRTTCRRRNVFRETVQHRTNPDHASEASRAIHTRATPCAAPDRTGGCRVDRGGPVQP
jgi:para-aminobenzoate synthetase/4-amino-4-deoxychorismate lyase